MHLKYLGYLAGLLVVVASQGDRSTEFTECLSQCITLMSCDRTNIFEEISKQRFSQEEKDANAEFAQEQPYNLKKREIPPSFKYTFEDFNNNYRISPIFQLIFQWDCKLDCNYKCQQFVSNNREINDLPMVQFYGKWPFKRIWGFTEFFLSIFSIGNLYVNWVNLPKILQQYLKNKKHNLELATMYQQYLILLIISVIGWLFSTLFHIRDNAVSETLDYFGAASIIMANFNAITIRYFELFKQDQQATRNYFQFGLVCIWILHITKLKLNWDYNYNTVFNLVFGASSIILWMVHSYNTIKLYCENDHIYNNSIQLLPFETKILTKLNYIGIISKTKYIPYIPIFLNLWLIFGISFEILDFEPWKRLIDGHAIWHLITIIPSIIWFDWNIWDLEMFTISQDLNKFN